MTDTFNELNSLARLKHYLPAQSPLKDFVHHNTLHAFQNSNFFDALRQSAHIFGNRTLLSLDEFRTRFEQGLIAEQSIESVLGELPEAERGYWKDKMLRMKEPKFWDPRIGNLRKRWKTDRSLDLDAMVWPKLVRLVNSYLDQGIAFQPFIEADQGLLNAVRHIQKHSLVKIFRSKRVIRLLDQEERSLTELLEIIVGDERFYEQYLFDQQFSHPGISGMVSTIEKNADSLYANRPATLFDLIYLELLFELEAIERVKGKGFMPLAEHAEIGPVELFDHEPLSDYWKVLEFWQEAFELSYHDQVLAGIKHKRKKELTVTTCQAFFCIDDRSESIRRNIELMYAGCQTYGTPGHFSIEAKFKPYGAQFSTQVCPASVQPSHLIKEKDRSEKQKKDIHFQRNSHKFLSGFVITQTVGFWSSIRLLINIFFPKESASQYNAKSDHMDFNSNLQYERLDEETEDGLVTGYTVDEMAGIVRSQLNSSGLTKDFAPLVYFFGHGGSSTNNPYFAGYNCGACSGRPGSLNARLFALMGNRKDVRELLAVKGITIPEGVHFIGGYHDTTQDTFDYFDEELIPVDLKEFHASTKVKFNQALNLNAKERARNFKTVNSRKPAAKVHDQVINRSHSLFEPRPEYNHANNAVYIIGRREITRDLFLDQRAFLNSYDHSTDPLGTLLKDILCAGSGVCGGINLEYFFSTVDNQKLGAGSKLPQNIFGLYGVANGVKGDLRPGLPWQMIDIHDPIRLMTIVEHDPEVVLKVIRSNEILYEWYSNSWIKLAVYNPMKKEIFLYKENTFVQYEPFTRSLPQIVGLESLIESEDTALPVYEFTNRSSH